MAIDVAEQGGSEVFRYETDHLIYRQIKMDFRITIKGDEKFSENP